VIISENADADVQRDLDAFLSRLVRDGDQLFTHTAEGPDDMSAHVRSALTATSVGIPVACGRLDLGTWQGVFLFEHRQQPPREEARALPSAARRPPAKTPSCAQPARASGRSLPLGAPRADPRGRPDRLCRLRLARFVEVQLNPAPSLENRGS